MVVDAFAQRKHQNVMDETWGHLAPKQENVYQGHILFAHGCFGDIVIIAYSFEGLDDSPWLYDDLCSFVNDNVKDQGHVFLWKGTYTYHADADEESVFEGTTEERNGELQCQTEKQSAPL